MDMLRVEAKLDKLPEVSAFVKKSLQENGFDDKFCRQVDVVVEEVYVNIASYAYPDGGDGEAVVECGRDGEEAVLTFKDRGVPYDPTKKDDPVIGDPDRMTIGGYGIFMVRQIMNEVSYRYDETTKENILTMRKK